MIKAWKADTAGNLIFKSAARNLNPDMAMACDQTIVEVEEIVEEGDLHPDQIHLPGIFVHKIIKTDPLVAPQKSLLDYLDKKKGAELTKGRKRILERAVKEVKDG